MADSPKNPLHNAREGWLLGSETFVARIERMIGQTNQPDQVPQARRLVLTAEKVVRVVADYYGVSPESYSIRRSTAAG